MQHVEKFAVPFALVAILAIVAGIAYYLPASQSEPVAVPVAVKITPIGADGYIMTSKRALVYASPSADW